MAIYTTTDFVIYDSGFNSNIRVYDDSGLVGANCSDQGAYGKLDFHMDVETTIEFANALLKQAQSIKEKV